MARHSEHRQVGTEGLELFAGVPRTPEGALSLTVSTGEQWAPRARPSDPATSHAAAASMRTAAHTQRLQILEYLGTCGERGSTADETDLALGWRSGRAGRRYGELVGLGLVSVASGTRKTSTGREAQVYVLPQYLDAAPTAE